MITATPIAITADLNSMFASYLPANSQGVYAGQFTAVVNTPATPTTVLPSQNAASVIAPNASNATSGRFEWIGAQDGGKTTGFQIGFNDLGPGDKIKITEPSGKYSGVHTVKYKGADDGTYFDTMVTLALPKDAGVGQTSGTWELVSRAEIANPNNAQPGDTNNGISPIILVTGVTLFLGGIGYAIYRSRNNNKNVPSK